MFSNGGDIAISTEGILYYLSGSDSLYSADLTLPSPAFNLIGPVNHPGYPGQPGPGNDTALFFDNDGRLLTFATFPGWDHIDPATANILSEITAPVTGLQGGGDHGDFSNGGLYPVPEPGASLLIAVTGLIVLLRRRR